MSHALIRQIFESTLTAWASTNSYNIFYENVEAEPTVDQIYIKSFLLPASTQSLTLAGDHEKFVGVFQVSIATPLGVGVGLANDIAEEIKGLFPIYQPFEKNGFKVQPISPLHVMDGIVGDASYVLPVSFRYRADTN